MSSSRTIENIQQYVADLGSLNRLYTLSCELARYDRLISLNQGWLESLGQPATDDLDAVLLVRHIQHSIRSLQMERARRERALAWIPFAGIVFGFAKQRRDKTAQDPKDAANCLNELSESVQSSMDALTPESGPKHEIAKAVEIIGQLKEALKEWFEYHNGYDPLFTWWAAEPYKLACEKLDAFVAAARTRSLGVAADDARAIVGDPVGREALLADLEHEGIPYTPEELIHAGEVEFAWCEEELKKAAHELGFGEDIRAALEHVKTLCVEPGGQTQVVYDFAVEAIALLEEKNLLTIPTLAKETWRMEMMAPERQKVNPFFLGGESIIISYPTHTMSHSEKLMSMRGNNPHFSRATVQHELIPGHHMQFFMLERYKPHRTIFETPFWIEGWALYWEMTLWDMGFPRGPEDRIGMLFWRIHRAARIVFSLKFHLGQMTAEECIQLLIDRVGHEPANAEGEVRRSFNGDYPPLYQCAYMIGAFQFRAMRRELVEGGKMTELAFHDAILRENFLPVAALRAVLNGKVELFTEGEPWRFLAGTKHQA